MDARLVDVLQYFFIGVLRFAFCLSYSLGQPESYTAQVNDVLPFFWIESENCSVVVADNELFLHGDLRLVLPFVDYNMHHDNHDVKKKMRQGK